MYFLCMQMNIMQKILNIMQFQINLVSTLCKNMNKTPILCNFPHRSSIFMQNDPGRHVCVYAVSHKSLPLDKTKNIHFEKSLAAHGKV